jgi:hypothetical protein
MEMIGYARKGNIMHIKENYYIYQSKQPNELTEEQKSIKDNDNVNSMFVTVTRHERHSTQHTTKQCLKAKVKLSLCLTN